MSDFEVRGHIKARRWPNDIMRPATFADVMLLHAWVNADDSLKWKKDTKNLIATDEHRAWFDSRLADPFTQIWIALNDGTPSGQVRLEKRRFCFRGHLCCRRRTRNRPRQFCAE